MGKWWFENVKEKEEGGNMAGSKKDNQGLETFLSPLAVMAFAVGTSVGWGAFVVTSNTYLKQAGPLGSIIGLLIGAVIMLFVCSNYHYISNKNIYKEDVFTYTKNIFGYDRAFLIAWFVFLLYISIFWANATAIPLFARYLIGDFFCFGHLYTLFGYKVFLGEILLTIAVIWITAFILINSKKLVSKVMIILMALFLLGVVCCFIAILVKKPDDISLFSPSFSKGSNSFKQIISVAFISPWAFIGFESVMHSSQEFSFSKNKIFKILAGSVVITTLLYVFLILISVGAYPGECSSWWEYINNLFKYDGLDGLPIFFTAKTYLGNIGIVLMFITLFSLVVTSLISNTWALIRLMYVAAKQSVISEKYTVLNKKKVPARAVIAVAVVSSFVPFLGRSAIGWIVDVTTIIATLLYGVVSVATMKCAKKNNDKKHFVFGLIVLLCMIVFGISQLAPIFDAGSLEAETYLIFILWSLFGMIFFHRVISKDHARHFGRAIIVWVVFISFIIILGFVWMNKIKNRETKKVIFNLHEFHEKEINDEINSKGNVDKNNRVHDISEDEYIDTQIDRLDKVELVTISVVLGLFFIAVFGLISNYSSMRKYETLLENEVAKKTAHILEMHNNLVLGMATMVESRDNSTGGHIKRTSDLVRILVEEIKKDEDREESIDTYIKNNENFYENVIKAAPMHDLGKIAVDDVILRKPGRFTNEEFAIMKTHAKEGERILTEILKNTDDEKFRDVAKNMAHFHHERVDGSGYPEKLKDEEIPLEARIMAIADVYDALVSKRVYKEKMSFEQADKIILEGMGTQFDKRLEKYYLSARPKFAEYYSSLQDE